MVKSSFYANWLLSRNYNSGMFWYEDEVRHLENKAIHSPDERQRVVFYGSSSVRLWETLAQDFPQVHVINQGFGGSTLAACAWYFDRLVLPQKPGAIICYAGDNDLGDGRHPEEVFLFLQALLRKVRLNFGNIRFTYLSIKPSIARWHLINQIKYTNLLAQQELSRDPDCRYVDIFYPMMDEKGNPKRELFEEDGLHLSGQGYWLWKQILAAHQHQIF